MYRIEILSGVLGVRYCFTKKSAKRLIQLFEEKNRMVHVSKFVRLHHDIFAWSAYEAEMALHRDEDE